MSPVGRASHWIAAGLLTVGLGCTGEIAAQRNGDDLAASAGSAAGQAGQGATTGGTSGQSGAPAPCRVVRPVRRLTPRQYINTVNAIFEGRVKPSLSFPEPSLTLSASGFIGDAAASSPTLLDVERMGEAAVDVALEVAANLTSLSSCAATPSSECAASFIQRYGERAFRRPLLPQEATDLSRVFDRAGGASTFADAIAAVTAAMLQMPEFVYHLEHGSDLASRLAYLIWDAPADAPLLAAAASGALGRPDGLATQLQRLLADQRARPVAARFFREWAGFGRVGAEDRRSSAWTPALAASVQASFDLFVENTFADPNGTWKMLLTSDRLWVDSHVGALVGASPPMGTNTFAAASRPGRSGLLTQPALLAGFAHEALTSYVERGVFVRTKLLCEGFPPPPADALARLPSFPPDATERQKSIAIRGVSACSGCHALIDPVGLAFEGFDEIGRARTADAGGNPIDVSGDVPGGPPGVAGSFQGVAELGKRLAASRDVTACVSRHFFAFAYGRPATESDACAIDSVQQRFTPDAPLTELVRALVLSEAFVSAKANEEAP